MKSILNLTDSKFSTAMDYLLGFAAIAYGAYGMSVAAPGDSLFWPMAWVAGGVLSMVFAIIKPHKWILEKAVKSVKRK